MDKMDLKKYGITKDDLLNECTSINVGAWIMANNVNALGLSWDAVGAYYAGFSTSAKQAEKRKWYAERVKLTYDEIKKKPQTSGAK